MDRNIKFELGSEEELNSEESDECTEIVHGPTENNPIDPAHVPKALRRSCSLECCQTDIKTESRVLVLYTGGTIGMVRNDNGVLVPKPNVLEHRLRKSAIFHDVAYAKSRFGHASGKSPLVLPNLGDRMRRALFMIYEYSPLLDSSNMTMDDWIQISKDLKICYENFDGFVILHGTDTLAYTASALSFMLENLGKTVIVTGSQIPIFETRSDGRDNFLSALVIAANYSVPEVCVFFNNRLHRGNRTTKVNTSSLDAFNSPNFAPLVNIGINIEVNQNLIFRPTELEKFHVHTTLNRNVGILRIFPSITTQTVKSFLAEPMHGVVLQTYGAGNIPSSRPDLMEALREATERGVIIINITQCAKGAVAALYETGSALLDVGVLPGYDMTPEAALTKLSYVLAHPDWDIETQRKIMARNIRGELTAPRNILDLTRLPRNRSSSVRLDIDSKSPLESLAALLPLLANGTSLSYIQAVLYPSFLYDAVRAGSIARLEDLKKCGVDLGAKDANSRDALFVATEIGNHEIVEYLLLNGVSVHSRDINGDNPLMLACKKGDVKIADLLLKTGAHLPHQSCLSDVLIKKAEAGDLRSLECFKMAGVQFNQPECCGHTALQSAVRKNQLEAAFFLLEQGLNPGTEDEFGLSCFDYAKRRNNSIMLELLLKYNTPNGCN
ncbi:L-asparaginase-like isoform X1 [Artemia franciscana]|uniref:asparaginase n=2 Tax=Artemia franciscana TaxID=6661 RepID=A0AA88KWJ1_ARTSF|nr:hypothetical protein QYM36_016541 [Artemia franciscana]